MTKLSAVRLNPALWTIAEYRAIGKAFRHDQTTKVGPRQWEELAEHRLVQGGVVHQALVLDGEEPDVEPTTVAQPVSAAEAGEEE